jgi:hypothetical protein
MAEIIVIRTIHITLVAPAIPILAVFIVAVWSQAVFIVAVRSQEVAPLSEAGVRMSPTTVAHAVGDK